MATASYRNSGSFDTLATHVAPKWWNGAEAEDAVFKPVPALWILSKVAKKSRVLPADVAIRVLFDQAKDIDSFARYDTVGVQASKGAQGARYTVANYHGPLTMSWEEEMEFTSDEATADRMEEYRDQVLLTFADRIGGTDLYKGSVSNSKNIVGLEQILFHETHSYASGTDLTYIPNLWRARQAANSIAGIQRVAYTGDTTAGTGWENVAIDGKHSTPVGFAYSSDAPNAALQALHQLYGFCSYGTDIPDLMIMSDKPFDEYEFAGASKVDITLNGNEFGDLNLGFFDAVKFKRAMVVRDRNATTKNSAFESGSHNVGDDNIYCINTKTFDLVVDPRADFSVGRPREAYSQVAATMSVLWRGQLVCKNPSRNGVYFGYDT